MTAQKTTFTARFSDGSVATRTSKHTYTHAVKYAIGYSFHKTEATAISASSNGKYGEVTEASAEHVD